MILEAYDLDIVLYFPHTEGRSHGGTSVYSTWPTMM